MRSHEWIDRRSLALHQAVAGKLADRPELMEVVRENLRRWLARDPQPALREWQRLVEALELDELLRLLRSPDERAARLRQSSPFAGVLSARERQDILDRHEPKPT